MSPRQKGKRTVRMDRTIYGSQELTGEAAIALRVAASMRMRHRAEASRLDRRVSRISGAPDRQSVAKAMLAVEERLVKAFWTIARQPLGQSAPVAASRCGIEYFHEREDVHARYADAAGGKWDSVAPRPSLPSSRDIDNSNTAMDWLLLIGDELTRKVLVIGATSKRGDAGRRIGWERLRPALREFDGRTVRTLQRKYEEALRIIVAELTLARVA
jgi:hypothetical protein